MSLTFIVPSIGRPTLQRALQSLLDQTNECWKAIIIYDGIESKCIIDDQRITYMQIDKIGKANHAGYVRNAGIMCANTEWVAFLDDDDTLHKNYVDNLYTELGNCPNVDCIIFRMVLNNVILPRKTDTTFVRNYVGISFAYKKCLFDAGLIFEPSGTEDFDLLHKLRTNKAKIIISPYVMYFVRKKPEDIQDKFNRIYINF